MSALVELITARAKEYEAVAQAHDADGSMLDRALDIVREFIIERGLILFGGQAIDCILRLKGTQIYPDTQRPDFDFLSPQSVDDAYDLADILHKKGFVGVGAIRAIHVQTTKVRVDFRWVADVGYASRAVFDSIPTFLYKGMRVVHPDFQRMDIHLAFCFPYSGAPREDIRHRWAKDLKRLNLLERYYPFGAHRAAVPERGLAAAVAGVTWTEARAARPLLLDPGAVLAPATAALHGFAAYALLRQKLAAVCLTSAPEIAIKFPDTSTVKLIQPCGTSVVVASPAPMSLIAGDHTWYDPYMDVRPESVRAGTLEILSTEGRLLAASRVDVALVDGSVATATIVSPQYLLLWFLVEAHRATSDAVRTIYRSYYMHTLTILREAEAHYAQGDDAAEKFAASPFAPTVATIGDTNNDSAYNIKMAEAAIAANEFPPTALGVPAAVLRGVRGLPARGYYPGSGKPRPGFNYSGCALFRRGGEPAL